MAPPECSKKIALDAENAVLDPNVKRYVHLDMMRVLCIFFVGVDHGYSGYSHHDVLFTQSWVLQCLWLICGMAWTMTKMPILGYEMRLCIYFAIGCSLNWLAWLYKGLPWQKDPMGVMYQFAFILGLMCYSAITVCLKAIMKNNVKKQKEAFVQAEEQQESLQTMAGVSQAEKQEALLPVSAPDPAPVAKPPLTKVELTAVKAFACVLLTLWVLMAVLGVFFANVDTDIVAKIIKFVLGESAGFWTEGLGDKEFFGQCLGTFGALLLAHVGAHLFKSPRLSPYLVWVLIFFIYMNRIFILPLTFHQFGGGVARFFVGFELFLIGLVGAVLGMRWAAALKYWMARYYVLFLLTAAFLWNPTWDVRMDEHPPEVMKIIFRVQVSELIWVIAFMASGSLWFTEESWPEWVRAWLSNFALALFLVHKAVHVAVDVPFNWLLIFGLLPLLTLWHKHGLIWKTKPWIIKNDGTISPEAGAQGVATAGSQPEPLDSVAVGTGLQSGTSAA